MEGKILIACRDKQCGIKLLQLFANRNLTIDSVWEDDDLLLQVLQTDYDVLIYDLEISKADGLKMVRILRKIRPKVPLVVIANDLSRELGGKTLHENVAYCAVKPIYPAAIEKVVFSALNQTLLN